MLGKLKEHNLLMDSRFLLMKDYVRITLLIPRWTKLTTFFCRTINSFLAIFSLPLFVLGVCYALGKPIQLVFSDVLLGLIIGKVVGLSVHELGHGCTMHTYGGRVFELGIFFVPFSCAYTYADCSEITTPSSLVQAYAAEIEANLAMAGMLLLSGGTTKLAGICVVAATINIEQAIINLLPLGFTDGTRIYSTLLGSENLTNSIFATVHKEMRQEALQEGMLGLAKLAVVYFVIVLRMMVLLLLILYVVGVCLWIF